MLSAAWLAARHSYACLATSLQVTGGWAPADALPVRVTGTRSDMFTVRLTAEDLQGGGRGAADAGTAAPLAPVSLEEYMGAFLLSPLFSAELWLLSKAGVGVPGSTGETKLSAVAAGRANEFAAWHRVASEGGIRAPIAYGCDDAGAKTDAAATSVGTVFSVASEINTWWGIHKQEGDPCPVLVFGSGVTPGAGGKPPLVYRLTWPLHSLYSRLLLASAKTHLVEMRRAAALAATAEGDAK